MQFCLPRIRAKKKRGNYLFTGFRIFDGFVLCLGEQFTQPMAVISRSRLRERSRRDRKRACLFVELWRKLAPYPYPIANIIWLLFTRVFFCRPLISVAIHPSCSFAAAAMLLAPKPQSFGFSKCRLITCFAEGGRDRRDEDDTESHSFFPCDILPTIVQGSARFGEFCCCCCLPLMPGPACSIHATWEPPFCLLLEDGKMPPPRITRGLGYIYS